MAAIERHSFERDGFKLSYLDSVEGKPLVALHAHWMEGSTFSRLADDLSPIWRVIALDQRGHGFSERSSDYSRSAYIADILGLFNHLDIDKAVVLGNSLGGVNAYQLAARNPQRVAALIVEDIGATINDDTIIALEWKGIYPTRAALEAKIGERLSPALRSSIRETAQGWRLAFDPDDMVISQTGLNGDHWDDWLASRCPALLIRGRQSRVSNAILFEQMAERRPNTKLVIVDGGHVVHFDNPAGFAHVVKEFLDGLADES